MDTELTIKLNPVGGFIIEARRGPDKILLDTRECGTEWILAEIKTALVDHGLAEDKDI